MQNIPKHCTVFLTFHHTDENAIKSPVSSGFRPNVKFPFTEEIFTAVLEFSDPELVFPGDTLTAEMTLLRADAFLSQIYEGQDFEMYDGELHIGHGTVSSVYNTK